MAILPWNRWKAEDVDDSREIDVHLDLEAEERAEAGASPLDARLAARRRFGSVVFAKEELREMRSGAGVDRLWQDARYAVRLLKRSPGFTAVAVFTLALAVAANTAIFSIVEAVMLRPLAFKDSEHLVSIVRVIPNRAGVGGIIAAVHFVEWRRSSRSFEALSMLAGGAVSLTGSGEPENVPGARVSANLFSMLGVTMQHGRAFLQEDEDHQARVAVISDALWKRRFAADSDVVGRTIGLSGTPFTIVGVLPPTFRFPSVSQLYFGGPNSSGPSLPEVWTPIAPAPFELDPRSPVQNYAAIGRLRPGVSAQQAAAELNALQMQLAKLSLDGHVTEVAVLSLRDFVARNYRAGLLMIWGSVGAVLLISCVNVANLLLARGARRRREMAVRSALGASRVRIARQLVIESLVLSAVSGAIGFAAAYWLVRAIVAFAPADVPRIEEVNLDWRVLVFMLVVVVADGMFFGVLPAWRSSNANPQDAMRFDSRTSTSGRESVRLRAALVSAEVGLCAVGLLIGGLLLQSFSRVLNVQRGFDVSGIQTVSIGLPATRYPVPKRAQFLRTALEQIQSIRSVTSAGTSTILPLTGGTGPGLSITVPGWTGDKPTVYLRAVDAGYFETLGIPLRTGRVFREEDAQRQVAIVSSLMARRLWPDESPLGKQFRMGPPTTSLFQVVFEVIGVVGDAHAESLTSELAETLYVPYWQDLSFTQNWSFALKTSDPAETARAVRTVLRDLDRELPIPAFRTMDDIVSGSVGQRRFQVNIVLMFAAAGLLLAGVGIYGVVAYSVAQRTNEMGIRMALGAKASAIRLMVVRQGLLPLVPGLLLGIVASLGAERFVSTLLYGVSPRDPVTIVAVVVLLTAVGLLASYLPARRATRINPVIALRYE
jgi:predicted permease